MKDDRTLVLGRHHDQDPSKSERLNSSTLRPSASQYHTERQASQNPRLHPQDIAAKEHSELQLIAAELAWYGELPLTSPSTALVFINKPKGSYHWPAVPIDTSQYNSGFFALVETHHANTVFLSTERRLCEIYTNLMDKLEDGGTDELNDQVDDIFDLCHEQVSRLCKEKEYHWDRQRSRVEIMANNPTDAILLNNGKLSSQLSIPFYLS